MENPAPCVSQSETNLIKRNGPEDTTGEGAIFPQNFPHKRPFSLSPSMTSTQSYLHRNREANVRLARNVLLISRIQKLALSTIACQGEKKCYLHLPLFYKEGEKIQQNEIIKMDYIMSVYIIWQQRTIKNNGVHYTCRQCPLK